MSNLLKDASILLTPTGYDNGSMNAIKPSVVLGLELITNGNFLTNLDGWILSPSTPPIWDNGMMKMTSDGATFSRADQSFVTKIGAEYKFKINKLVNNNSVLVKIGNSISGSNVLNQTLSSINEYTFTITAISTTTYIRLEDGSGTDGGYVSNISVKEDLNGDFTFSRNSAATRVNAQGLVENVQILSSNLVSNGDFSQEGVQKVSNGSFSQEGAEEITNGDFATDSDWTLTSSGDSSSNVIIANGSCQIISDGTLTGLTQTLVTTIGKTYKCTINISSVNNIGGGIAISNGNVFASSIATFTTAEIHTFYFEATSTSVSIKRASGLGGSIDYTIDSVSVKEVGQDWILGTGWSIGDGKAVYDGVAEPYLTNLNPVNIAVGDNLKFTFVLDSSAKLRFVNESGLRFSGTWVSYASGTHEVILTSGITATQIGVQADTDNGAFSITNISVKEVGQDWTLGTGWSIGDSKVDAINAAFGSSFTQNMTVVPNRKYKVSFDVSDYVKGNFRIQIGNTSSSEISSNGSFTFFLTSANTDILKIETRAGGQGTTLSISNISILEITNDTNLPRINYEGFSYQDSLGSEEVVNGDFATDSNWIKNGQVTIGGGVAYFNSDGTFTQIAQSISGVSGKNVKVVIEITEYTQGTLKVLFSGGTQQNLPNSIGVHTLYFNNADSDTINIARLGGVTNLKIDNVSVKEVLGQEVVPNSGCGNWLLEPQSTNTVRYSEDFSQWVQTSSPTLTSGQLAPDGTLSATKISGAIGSSNILLTGSSTTSTTASRSIYARTVSGTGTAKLMSYFGNTNNLFTLTEEWQRFELTGSVSAGGDNFYIDFRDNAQTLSEFIIWGAQSEVQSYATSYIPTQGASSTRLQDIATNSGNASLINSEEGVLYAEIAALANDQTDRLISITNGTASERISLFYGSGVSNQIKGIVFSGGALSANLSFISSNITNLLKVAISYKLNDFALWVNGIKVATDTSGLTPSVLNTLSFDLGTSSTFLPFYGKTKALAVYKTALTDEQLTLLTTI